MPDFRVGTTKGKNVFAGVIKRNRLDSGYCFPSYFCPNGSKFAADGGERDRKKDHSLYGESTTVSANRRYVPTDGRRGVTATKKEKIKKEVEG